MTRPPRVEAALALGRVLRSGAYSNVLLRDLSDEPDSKLIRRLVYGTLRYLLRVDRLIERASTRPLSQIDPGVLDLLRIGTWELRFGDGAPHAAVNEAVKAATAGFGKPAGGFVNAVLRNAQSIKEALPEGAEGASLELGVKPWIYERLVATWGEDDASAFLRASLEPAKRTARVRPGANPVEAIAIPGIEGAVEADRDVTGLIPMDPSSVAVGIAADVSPGMVVLDLAAAPGGKTLHLYDELGKEGWVVASDSHPGRVMSARRRFNRLGVGVPWLVADGRRVPFAPATFDRVLLDAPCTGLGTLRRRPEIRHRLRPESPRESAELQNQLLDAALELVKPDGVVVYSVCTVFREETVDVVAARRAEPPADLPGRAAGNGWLLGPHLSRTDGMFISLVRP